MAKAIFKVFFTIIKKIVDIFLLPINTLVVNIFPNLASVINTFNYGLRTIGMGGLQWFSNLLPNGVRTMVLLWLGVLISYYGILFTIHGILKVIDIIKRIKVW